MTCSKEGDEAGGLAEEVGEEGTWMRGERVSGVSCIQGRCDINSSRNYCLSSITRELFLPCGAALREREERGRLRCSGNSEQQCSPRRVVHYSTPLRAASIHRRPPQRTAATNTKDLTSGVLQETDFDLPLKEKIRQKKMLTSFQQHPI